jgi:ectoine hydroxylase-related dioxygenase (phytanoyl-CoA dioxygenase family)
MIDPGYWIEPAVLSEKECEQLIAALSNVQRSRAGARHLMRNPAIRGVASDHRLQAIARKALGTEATPFRATLFEKSQERNWLIAWHQDTALPLESFFDAAGWGPWSEKGGIPYAHAPAWALSRVIALRVHLDSSTSENGVLRVVPSSHRFGVLTDDEVFELARGQVVECSVPRGGVLMMRPLLIHSSAKASSANPRRVLHVEYADSLDLERGIRLATA